MQRRVPCATLACYVWRATCSRATCSRAACSRGVLGMAVTSAQPRMPTLVILNAKVHTVDGARPSAQAIAVSGETI